MKTMPTIAMDLSVLKKSRNIKCHHINLYGIKYIYLYVKYMYLYGNKYMEFNNKPYWMINIPVTNGRKCTL
jgi:hypothetical protein